MFFQTLDILYIVLAFCALWLTVFLCWLLWQASTALKNINDLFAEAQEKLDRMEQALSGMSKRFELVGMSLGVVGEGIRKAMEFAFDRASARRASKEESWEEPRREAKSSRRGSARRNSKEPPIL